MLQSTDPERLSNKEDSRGSERNERISLGRGNRTDFTGRLGTRGVGEQERSSWWEGERE